MPLILTSALGPISQVMEEGSETALPKRMGGAGSLEGCLDGEDTETCIKGGWTLCSYLLLHMYVHKCVCNPFSIPFTWAKYRADTWLKLHTQKFLLKNIFCLVTLYPLLPDLASSCSLSTRKACPS